MGWMPTEIHITDLLLHLLEWGYPNHDCGMPGCKAEAMYKRYIAKYGKRRVIDFHSAVLPEAKLTVAPMNCKFYCFCKRTCFKKEEYGVVE